MQRNVIQPTLRSTSTINHALQLGGLLMMSLAASACDLDLPEDDSTTSSGTTTTVSGTHTTTTTDETTTVDTESNTESDNGSSTSMTATTTPDSTASETVTTATTTTGTDSTTTDSTTTDSTTTDTNTDTVTTTTTTTTATDTTSTDSDSSSTSTDSTEECVPDTTPGKKGLTWAFIHHQSEFGIDLVGCGGTPVAPSTCARCDPYQGDTNCNAERPLLCLNVFGASRPPYAVSGNDQGLPKEGYYGWSEGVLELSRPVAGTSLATRADADRVCAEQFGPGFRLAEHHDGRYIVGMSDTQYFWETWPEQSQLSRGGWHLWSYGEISSATRFWVHINDQSANCWSQ